MRKRKVLFNLLKGILTPCFMTIVFLLFLSALGNLEAGRQEEESRQLQEVLRKGCAACYASEGTYPPDLNYLKDHYGVQIDESRYDIRYERFAQNLMPDITVLENEP